ncbi:FAD-dependent monooxygenase [Mycolicibacterium sp. lyk4-40-TYG-92]|uniref:FAD-dependent monooxygenase n=1 Tax=Mycolicibacterium sp. lyk4-40-TYG-92 TaxID=3040295 RepID=UPI00254FC97B|nr:FAD-dependent monooxygenase [Mycolicibacterium sp. lyk4-40-TYG-92]
MRIPLLIVGGGIGGMSAAVALAHAGFAVHVVEQASEFSEIGAGIQLAPNAMRILDGLGLLSEINKIAVQPSSLIFHDIDTGAKLTTVDMGEPFIQRYGYPYTVLHRGDLLEVLLAACRANDRITLEPNKAMTDISDQGDWARVEFADGTSYECDAVVGADGLWSKTRRLVSDDQPVCSSYVAYRGAVPIADLPVRHDDDAEIIWIGPDRHLVQYPIRGGELYNQVAVFHSHRYRPGMENDTDWGTPDELDEHFGVACEQVRASVTLFKRERRWPMFDREPIDNWTTGRITLLGDAAHPMLQYLAQGACQAIEDAGCLAEYMVKHDGDIVEAFASYQQDRLPRTAEVQTIARAWGEIWHASDAIVPALRNRVLARSSDENYADLDWLYQAKVL